MTIYFSDATKLGFDFDSTEPPVFEIIVEPRDGHDGTFAEAIFRTGLYSVTCWSETEELAIGKLLEELRTRYTIPVVIPVHTPTPEETMEKFARIVECKKQQGAPIGRIVMVAGKKADSREREEYGE